MHVRLLKQFLFHLAARTKSKGPLVFPSFVAAPRALGALLWTRTLRSPRRTRTNQWRTGRPSQSLYMSTGGLEVLGSVPNYVLHGLRFAIWSRCLDQASDDWNLIGELPWPGNVTCASASVAMGCEVARGRAELAPTWCLKTQSGKTR